MLLLADLFRRGLILGIWGTVTILLWGIWWVWAVLWVIPGFIIILNLVGFATLPIYFRIGGKRASKIFQELEDRVREENAEPPEEAP